MQLSNVPQGLLGFEFLTRRNSKYLSRLLNFQKREFVAIQNKNIFSMQDDEINQLNLIMINFS